MKHQCLQSVRLSREVAVVLLLAGLLGLLVAPPTAVADTSGKLTGKVVDQNSEPVTGANVVLVGTSIGGVANLDGVFTVLNVPVGIYDVRVGAVGYQARLVKGVTISAGQTTTLNVTITETMIETDEVVTVVERPLVDTRMTSAMAILSKDDIAALPVQSLNDVVGLQAGVVDGHFRGGRAGEVQYQVDGVSVNNPYDNSSVLQLDKSVLQEVQVISGTFDPEYGQAMSGVVNAVLRTGPEDSYEASAEVYAGSYVPGPANSGDFPYVHAMPPAIQNYMLSVGGPVPLPRTSFLLTLRRYQDEGYLYGVRRFVPTDTSDFARKIFRPTGDDEEISLASSEEWSGQLKIANRALGDVQISYQAIGSTSKAKAFDFAYRFNPDGQRTQKRFSLVHGFEFSHSLSPELFYTVSLRQNYFHYKDYMFESVSDPLYGAAGVPRGDANYELGAILQGYSLGRFEQKTNALLLKGAVTAQLGQYNLVKLGVEAQTSSIGFGSPGTLGGVVLDGTQSDVYLVPDSLAQPYRTYYPVSVAAFLQDRVEFADFLVRAGVRLEFYDSRSTTPSDLENPANVIEGAPASVPVQTARKVVVAPRLGVSYPITAGGAIYFSWGHFYQMPGLGNLYANSDYSILKNLQSGATRYGVMGNPDIRPELTKQYEFGMKQEFARQVGIDLSVYYKDIQDLLGVEFIDTYADSRYARYTNVDFGSVYGVKTTVDYRLSESVVFSLNYTFQNALGNSSDPSETANRAAAGEDPRPRQIPFEWDQRHTLNLSLALTEPKEYSATVILRYGSGSPYTPSVGSGFGALLERNSSAKPTWTTVDLRGEWYPPIGIGDCYVFMRVVNLFDSRYSNGFVFSTTGSPYYTLTAPADAVSLINPARYAAPRRIELGIGLRY
ncbi:MAG TPA: TonB-dependent receptor [Bacteroidota bacterium]|nr:TonB-dependent receptor [Bacteroidota bacterium]